MEQVGIPSEHLKRLEEDLWATKAGFERFGVR
jgi:hypothetical protein